MAASVVSMDRDVVTLEVKIKLSGSMLEAEERILEALNEAGCLATGKALERFDADGSRIELGGVKWSSKALPVAKQPASFKAAKIRSSASSIEPESLIFTSKVTTSLSIDTTDAAMTSPPAC
jgi:hypothetical protein